MNEAIEFPSVAYHAQPADIIRQVEVSRLIERRKRHFFEIGFGSRQSLGVEVDVGLINIGQAGDAQVSFELRVFFVTHFHIGTAEVVDEAAYFSFQVNAFVEIVELFRKIRNVLKAHIGAVGQPPFDVHFVNEIVVVFPGCVIEAEISAHNAVGGFEVDAIAFKQGGSYCGPCGEVFQHNAALLDSAQVGNLCKDAIPAKINIRQAPVYFRHVNVVVVHVTHHLVGIPHQAIGEIHIV